MWQVTVTSNTPAGSIGVEVLQGKPEGLSDSEVDSLRQENEALKTERNTPQHKLYTEIEELKERNRLLLIKSREERQVLREKISALEYRDESQSRRLQEKQARLDELEVQLEQARDDYAKLLESSTHVTNKLREEAQVLRSQLEIVQAENEALRTAQPATEFELPEPADLLNQLKTKRKKATASLADIEAILEILERG